MPGAVRDIVSRSAYQSVDEDATARGSMVGRRPACRDRCSRYPLHEQRSSRMKQAVAA
jgi:hypothetical protein